MHRLDEPFLKALLGALAEGVVVQDAQGEIVYSNAVAERILGLSWQQLQGESAQTLEPTCFHEDGSLFPAIEHPAMVTLRTGAPCRNIVMGIRQKPEQQMVWIRINSGLIPPGNGQELRVLSAFSEVACKNDGRVSSVFGTNGDLTKSAQALQVQLQSFIEHLPVAAAMFDRKMSYLAVSKHWLNAFGFGRDQLVGCNHYELYPELSPDLKLVHQRCLRGETISRDEDRWLRSDGGELWFSWAAQPWFDADGSIGGISITAEDITRRKRLQDAIFQAQSDLAESQKIAHLGSWVMEHADQHVRCSRELFNIFGITGDSFLIPYQDFLGAVHDEDRQRVNDAYLTSMDNSAPASIEYRIIRHSDGQMRWCQGQWGHERNATGLVIRSIGTVIDITDRKKMEIKLSQFNAELEQFASIAAHDLRSPLKMIASYLELIQNKIGNNISNDVKTYLGHAVEGARNMDLLISDILAFSRAGAMPNFESVDLTAVVGEVLHIFNADLRAIDADVNIAEDFPKIIADHTELVRIFENLLSNAIKYRSSLRILEVDIGWRNEPGHHLVWVRDNGRGIAPKDRELAFKLFHRLPPLVEQGTGIGLSICRKLIERFGGSIWVESEFAQGTTVFMKFPTLNSNAAGLS